MRRIFDYGRLAALLVVLCGRVAAGEYEDLGDKWFDRRDFEKALTYYRKAIARNPRREALWPKYDRSLEEVLLARGTLMRPSSVAMAAAASTSAATASEAPGPLRTASIPIVPLTTPHPPVTAGQRDAPPEIPSSPVFRPGEIIDIDAVQRSSAPLLIEGDRFRLESIDVSRDVRGRIRVRGRLVNTGDGPFNYPQVFAKVFDKQRAPLGHMGTSLGRSRQSLAKGASDEFEITIVPAYTNALGAYSLEVTGTR